MKNGLRWLSISFVLLAYAIGALAQDGHQWSRNPASGKVQYKGSLPWPPSVTTEAQRRDLVRQWYLAKLTDVKPEDMANLIAHEGVTYDGLPKAACFEYKADALTQEYFYLWYEVKLTLSSTGLTYRLSNFSHGYFSIDVGESDSLENTLVRFPTGRPELAVFQKRLLAALASW